MTATTDAFLALSGLREVEHAFTTRLLGDGCVRHADHPEVLAALPLRPLHWRRAHQVHGIRVASVTSDSPEITPDTDALCTAEPRIALVISVADCCPVYVVHPQRRVIGLAHSGRRGTEEGILTALLRRMETEYQADPAGCIVQLGPCIRPPHYEIDFAAEIVRQAQAEGVGTVVDCGISTAAHPERYLSYRMEKGQTGRMAAVLMLL